ALCRVDDALGGRWKMENGFLLSRDTAYFWDKLKEVPNRYLERWMSDRKSAGSLPLEDLLEMTGLSEAQLESTVVGRAVTHCWNLPEWHLLSGGSTGLQPHARFLAVLTPPQRRQA